MQLRLWSLWRLAIVQLALAEAQRPWLWLTLLTCAYRDSKWHAKANYDACVHAMLDSIAALKSETCAHVRPFGYSSLAPTHRVYLRVWA